MSSLFKPKVEKPKVEKEKSLTGIKDRGRVGRTILAGRMKGAQQLTGNKNQSTTTTVKKTILGG